MVNIEDITYECIINFFLAYPTKDNYQDVVFSIHWELKATYVDINDKKFMTSSRYITSVDTDNISEFVPFEELTLNQTIEWINQTDSVNDYKQYLCDVINNQMNHPPPTVISLPPPFPQ